MSGETPTPARAGAKNTGICTPRYRDTTETRVLNHYDTMIQQSTLTGEKTLPQKTSVLTTLTVAALNPLSMSTFATLAVRPFDSIATTPTAQSGEVQ